MAKKAQNTTKQEYTDGIWKIVHKNFVKSEDHKIKQWRKGKAKEFYIQGVDDGSTPGLDGREV